MGDLNKKAKEELAETLKKHKSDIELELRSARFEMKRLVKRQTVLKRKRSEIDNVVNALVS